MRGTKLQRTGAEAYTPLLILEDIFPHPLRQTIKRIIGLLVLFLFVVTIAASSTLFMSLLTKQSGIAASGGFIVLSFAPRFLFIALIVWLIIFALEAYYYSNYFFPTGASENATEPSYEVAHLLYHGGEKNFLENFFESPYGREIIARSGIPYEAAKAFGAEKGSARDVSGYEFIENTKSLRELAEAIVRGDETLRQFLLAHEVTDEIFIAAAAWVERRIKVEVLRERWWRYENLRQVRGLGESWSYGETPLLDRFGTDIEKTEIFAAADTSSPYGRAEAESLKTILSRTREANAILVGEAGIGTVDIVARFAREIAAGSVEPRFASKRVFLVPSEAITAVVREKAEFERTVKSLFEQAIAAGNIILAFENLPSFIESAHVLGVDFTALIDHYLESDQIQVIATSERDTFHRTVAKFEALMKRFEVVMVEQVDRSLLVRVVQDAASTLEKKEGILFTYPAIETIAESADRYFPYGVMPDKALDLLYEVAAKEARAGNRTVLKKNVLELVTERTKIPFGSVQAGEREKLERLEELLHGHVVGQDAAISAIASALRRGRSGLVGEERPIGSFLFLGPSGVGKTETAKALAAVFFENEKSLLRFDISEYATTNAIERLIGSLEEGSPGTLALMLREHPYGVLLLDEFEKAGREVHNLFLQVLDEGYFTDMRGRRVSARNLIIIATSNAGAERIWELFQQGENPATHSNEIIDMLVKDGIFSPELLNRFDGVIVYHPLDKEQLREIAKRLLRDLAARLIEQGITLGVDDPLIEKLVSYGYDPKFGARPMRRALQERIEEPIAKKIIAGELKPGGRVDLTNVL